MIAFVPKTVFTADAKAFDPSRQNSIEVVVSSTRSRRFVNSEVTICAFSVSPRTSQRTCFEPSSATPRATTIISGKRDSIDNGAVRVEPFSWCCSDVAKSMQNGAQIDSRCDRFRCLSRVFPGGLTETFDVLGSWSAGRGFFSTSACFGDGREKAQRFLTTGVEVGAELQMFQPIVQICF